MTTGLALGASAGLVGLGCTVPTSFSCTEHEQCGDGVCVAGGCAYPSDDCPSGLRYGALSPPLFAGLCVGVDVGDETDTSDDADPTDASSTDDSSMTQGDGDGDGDGDTNGDGDGDGDTNSGDGDGDTNSGDGDGDTNSGDGDGDGDIPDTALAHYSFDELAGATVFDATANGFDAAMANGQSTAPGVVGQGLSFANLDSVIVPAEVLAGQAAFTVEFYMRSAQVGPVRHFVFYYGSEDASPPTLTTYVEYSVNPLETARVLWTGGNNQTTGLIGSTNLGPDGWHHVALTVSAQGLRLYVDHFLEAEDPFNPSPGLPGYPRIQIGGTATGFGSFYGVIDELRFSAGALSPNEMQPVP